MIVYAPSYQSIFLIGWLLSKDEPVTILTGNRNLIKLFEEWKLNFIELPDIFPVSHKKIKALYSNKNYLNDTLKKLSDKELYFSFNAHDIRGFYIVQWWLDNNKVVYWKDLDPVHPLWKWSFSNVFSKATISTITKRIILIIVLKLRLKVVGTASPILGVTNEYLKSRGVHFLDTKEKEIRVSALEYFPKHSASTNIIIATEGPSAYNNYFNSLQYWEIVNNLFYKIKSDISIKFHPSLNYLDIKLKSPYPAYLPIEFILHNAKIVIGVYSASLIAAAQNLATTVISILEMLEWESIEKKLEALNFLNSDIISRERIKYPKSIKELYALLKPNNG